MPDNSAIVGGKEFKKMRLISIVTPCYNEEENVRELYERVKKVMSSLAEYGYEHIFIDNASTDRSVDILRQIAEHDRNVKVIINARNFGHIRSPYHALLQTKGDAVISIVADLQDPPEMIMDFIKKWEDGYRIVVGVKEESEESHLFFAIRKLYYNIIGKLSDIRLIKNFTGFGLYDKKVIEILRHIEDPYPYFRGLICDIGYKKAEIPYVQPARRRGFSKNNFYTLYDMAMLGITNHSKVPLRIATFTGFITSMLSMLAGISYFVYKVLSWRGFEEASIPFMFIGAMFLFAVQLMFIGILGEYIGSIHTQVLKRPLVIEKERINFDAENSNR